MPYGSEWQIVSINAIYDIHHEVPLSDKHVINILKILLGQKRLVTLQT